MKICFGLRGRFRGITWAQKTTHRVCNHSYSFKDFSILAIEGIEFRLKIVESEINENDCCIFLMKQIGQELKKYIMF